MGKYIGQGYRLVPYKNKDGTYRTGLTEELQKKYEELTGYDLSPTSEYFNPFGEGPYHTTIYNSTVPLNMNNIEDRIKSHWINAHRWKTKV